MNETLVKTVNELITRSLTAVDTATSFLAAEIPDVIRQLLVWHMARAGVWATMGLLLLLAALGVWVWWISEFKKSENNSFFKDHNGNSEVTVLLPVFGSVFLLTLGVPMFMSNFMDLLHIWIAPKLYLIEYGASLIKSVSK